VSRALRRGLESTTLGSLLLCRPAWTAAPLRWHRADQDEKMLSAEQEDWPKKETIPRQIRP
jgi:hypothetical protein